jgi:hypothetical protein
MSIRISRTFTALAASAGIGLSASAAAAPLVITACTTLTQPGSYVVGNNLNAAGSDCLVVANDFITIDLNGFLISGIKAGSGVTALRNAAFRGITVRNGTITGFAQAILLTNSTGVTVERINATANSGDAIVAGDGATVRDSVAVGNGGSGIRLGQRALVSGNNSEQNGFDGILVGIGGNIVGNTVGLNKASGISTVEGANIVNNVSRNNSADGIVTDCPSAVVANTTSNNLGQNLNVIGGVGCIVNANNSTI